MAQPWNSPCRERLGGLLKYYYLTPHEFIDRTGKKGRKRTCQRKCGLFKLKLNFFLYSQLQFEPWARPSSQE